MGHLKRMYNAKAILSTLLYKGTRDGWRKYDFHSRCDSKDLTIVLCKSDRGKNFGGFTPLPWLSESATHKDPNMQSFLFSLEQLAIYPLTDPRKHAIECYSYQGPCFGNNDLSIGNSFADKYLMTKKLDSQCKTGEHYNIPVDPQGNSFLTGEKLTFSIVELEVFQLKIVPM